MQGVSPNADDAQAYAGPGATLSVLKEEVDTALRPVRAAATARQPARSPDAFFQSSKGTVEARHVLAPRHLPWHVQPFTPENGNTTRL